MAAMSRQARAILQSRRADRLSDAARQRLEESLLQSVEHGQGPLAQNEVEPSGLPSISWRARPDVIASWLTLVGLGSLALGAIISRTATPRSEV